MSQQKNYVLITIGASGTHRKLVQSSKPTLDQMQKAVGGYIETVPCFTRLSWPLNTVYTRGAAYCNEYGKISDPPMSLNRAATLAWRQCIGRTTDMLVGDVLFVARTDEEVTT